MLDIVVTARAGIEQGTDVPAAIRFRAGGSAANTARAFTGLGGAATFVGAVGGDPLGRRLTAALRAAGVTVHAVALRGSTARLVALVAPNGERSFLTDRGVADDLPRASIRAAWLRRVDVVHLPAYSLLTPPLADATLAAAVGARAAGALVSVDLASRRPLLDAGAAVVLERLRGVAPDVIFANANEVAAVVDRRHPRRLLEIAPTLVIKEGAAGCRVLWRGEPAGEVLEIDVATKPVLATDTTGAGDAFDAGFLFAVVSAGVTPQTMANAATLRRAALSGHRAATRLLTSPRIELAL